MSCEPRPRRRWFQFSLWSLMFLMSVTASYFAGLAYHRDVIRRLRADLEQAKAEQARLRVEKQWAIIKKQVSSRIEDSEADFIRAKEEQAEAGAILDNVKSLGRDIEAKARRRARSAAPSDNAPPIVPARVPRLESTREFWERFQLHGEKPSRSGKKSIPPPKTSPELQFDAPLINRTIG